MKVEYLIPPLVFALGLGLIIFGVSSNTEMTLLGLTLHPRIAKGLGIIITLFSVITILVTLSSSQPPGSTGRRG